MKTLLILVLVIGLAGALFFTRPTKADFETYIKTNTKIVDGKATGGTSLADKLAHQLKTFAANTANQSAADLFLSHCTYDNNWLWTNVKYDGKLIYTGALGHWFERSSEQQGSRSRA